MERIAGRLLSKEAITKKTGLSNSTIYRAIHTLAFPKPVRVGKESFWPEQLVDDWISNRKMLGLRGPFPRRFNGRKAKQAGTACAPKPRIYRDDGAWVIRVSDNQVLRSGSPQLVYNLWQNWRQTSCRT